MIRFIDGPVAGAVLSLRRTPVMLRVVEGRDDIIDALDELDDDPKPSETIYVYMLASVPQTVHIDRGEINGRHVGEWHTTAEYTVWPQQPTDDQMRTTDAWRAWVESQRPQIMDALGPAVLEYLRGGA